VRVGGASVRVGGACERVIGEESTNGWDVKVRVGRGMGGRVEARLTTLSEINEPEISF